MTVQALSARRAEVEARSSLAIVPACPPSAVAADFEACAEASRAGAPVVTVARAERSPAGLLFPARA